MNEKIGIGENDLLLLDKKERKQNELNKENEENE